MGLGDMLARHFGAPKYPKLRTVIEAVSGGVIISQEIKGKEYPGHDGWNRVSIVRLDAGADFGMVASKKWDSGKVQMIARDVRANMGGANGGR